MFGLPTVDLHENFSDILKDLDFAFMAAGDARYDRFSLFTDINYPRVTTDAATPRGVVADEVDVKSVTFTSLLGVGYTVYEDPKARLDVVAGARYWHVETRVALNGGLIGNLSRTDTANWVDGLVGIKGNYLLTDKAFLTGSAMIGVGVQTWTGMCWQPLATSSTTRSARLPAIAPSASTTAMTASPMT